MLRRDLRDIWNTCAPTSDRKEQVLAELLKRRPKDVEMKGRKWHAKGQAGAWILIFLVLSIAFAGIGYVLDYYGVTEYVAQLLATKPLVEATPSSDTAPTVVTVPTQTEPEQLSYQPLAAKYVRAIQEDWDMERCEQEDISYLVMFLDKPEDLNCAFIDLDDNGVQEMIVTDGNVIYDLYTCSDGDYVHLISGAERNSYTLTADYMIANVASGGAGNTIYRFYLYFGTNLIPVEMIVCDASRDPQNPWFRGIDDIETVEPITEKDAREIIAMYPAAPISSAVITIYD